MKANNQDIPFADDRQASSGKLYEGPINDCHFHFDDFPCGAHTSFEVMLDEMNSLNVDRVFCFGMQVRKVWHEGEPKPRYYDHTYGDVEWNLNADARMFHDYQRLSNEQRQRFHLSSCGFNPLDLNCISDVTDTLDRYGTQVCGLGEVLLSHGLLTHQLNYKRDLRPSNVALEAVLKLAGRQDLPVLLHHDVRLPGERGLSGIDHLTDALNKHENTKILWAHCGINRDLNLDIDRYCTILAGLLARHNNLYCDLSWDVCWNEFLLNSKNGLIWPRVQEVIERFPEQFLIGSDGVAQRGVSSYSSLVTAMRRILGQLSPDIADLVASQNFKRIIPSTVATGVTQMSRI